jgi:Spy/CpxP family protein refolding chaperone
MKTKTKTTLIILGTFVIGIIIGALASGTWRQKREHRFERMMPHQRFLRVMERIIQPTDEQREAIDQILKKRSEQISAIQEEHESEVQAILDSLRSDLASVLTEEQRARLEKRLAKGDKKLLEIQVARLAEALQLDENQRRQIKKIFSKFAEQKGRRHKGFKGNREKRRQIMKDRFEKLQAEIEAVLTPEQREKYRKMRHEMHPAFARPFRGPKPGRHFREREWE